MPGCESSFCQDTQPIRQSCVDTCGVGSIVRAIDQTTSLFIHLDEPFLPWPPPERLTEESACCNFWRLSLHSLWPLLPSEFSMVTLSFGSLYFVAFTHTLNWFVYRWALHLMNWKNSGQEFCIRKAYLHFIENEMAIYKWKFLKLFCWVLIGIIFFSWYLNLSSVRLLTRCVSPATG